jgi:hypothetical protein
MTATRQVTEQQIVEELQGLEPGKWFEVLDFVGYLKHRTTLERVQVHSMEMTAYDLLWSELVGLWADRHDIGDSLSFARQVRQQAEHRSGVPDGAV